MTTSKTVFIGLDELMPEGVLETWHATKDVRPARQAVEGASSGRQEGIWTRLRSTFAAGGFVLVMAFGSTDADADSRVRPVVAGEADRRAATGEVAAQAGMWATRLYLATRKVAEQLAHPPTVSIEQEPPGATVELGLPTAWVGVVISPVPEQSGWYLARREPDDTLTRESGPLSTMDAEAVIRRALA